MPQPGTALSTAKDIKISNPEVFIKYFHDYPTVGITVSFHILGFKVKNTVSHVVSSQQRKVRATQCQAMG